MLQFILDYRIDTIAFDAVMASVAVFGHFWLKRRHGAGAPRLAWCVLAWLLVAGAAGPEFTGHHEATRLRDMLSGIAPTYAQEMQLAGHGMLTLQTPANDPQYLQLIEAEKRWQRANPNVSDVYTFRKRADGQVVLLVDSETDYDHNGRFEGEREQRTSIGEVYSEPTPQLLKAFDGVASFDAEPYSDRWGTWVSAYVPLYDAAGKVEGVLGVDYDARNWTVSVLQTRAGTLALVATVAVILLASTALVVITRNELVKREKAEREREKLQAQLLVASRQAGMAEVATGVLHNVGNVLNSVNVATGTLAEKMRGSKVAALVKATAMIRDNRGDIGNFVSADPRGKLLPDYLIQLAELLSAEQDSFLKKLAGLAESVDHIKGIVAAQQGFAKCVDATESLELDRLIDEAVKLNSLSAERHQVTVERDFKISRPVLADRHKLLQILVNLLSNAQKAVAAKADRRLVFVGIDEFQDETGRAMARVRVKDNGMGIKPENLAKVFTHGFTTRKDGHGFGLHFSAIAAQQMKGKLSAESDGEGQGAVFVLEVPLAPTEVVAPCK